MAAAPEPFKIDIPDERIEIIMGKVASFEWFETPEEGSWAWGMDRATLRQFVDYWQNEFDWRKVEAELNGFAHFKADVGGTALHFIHEKGSGENPTPLIISHGWPGSFVEFLGVIDKLAHPEKHGGNADDGFSVVVPSLPGYGFSEKPSAPVGPAETARLFNLLMTETLGYESYVAQGGDWGSAITARIAHDFDACTALHLNMMIMMPGAGAPETEKEIAWSQKSAALRGAESAYFQEQSTKPQTLGVGLMDSSVGLAAWILEKFHGWSDLDGDDLTSVYTMEQLITNVMIYAVTRTIHTSTWFYYSMSHDPANFMPSGDKMEKPVGFAIPKADISIWPPRSHVEKAYKDIRRWTEVERGGHFLAMERPDTYVEEVRAFFNGL